MPGHSQIKVLASDLLDPALGGSEKWAKRLQEIVKQMLNVLQSVKVPGAGAQRSACKKLPKLPINTQTTPAIVQKQLSPLWDVIKAHQTVQKLVKVCACTVVSIFLCAQSHFAPHHASYDRIKPVSLLRLLLKALKCCGMYQEHHADERWEIVWFHKSV